MTVTFEDLKEQHKEINLPKLRLWARMITSDLYMSTEELPNAPLFNGTVPKRAKRESIHDVVVSGTKVVAQVFTGSTSQCSYPTHITQSTLATFASTTLTISQLIC